MFENIILILDIIELVQELVASSSAPVEVVA